MEHHVYFWLKEQCKNQQDRESFERGLDSLLKLPGLVGGVWGRPAAVMERPVIDRSWDYALSMTFESVAAHDAYQVDPDHNIFVSEQSPKWEKVLVMDLEPNH